MKRFNTKTRNGIQNILTIVFTSLFATSILSACVPNPLTNQCIKPLHNPNDKNDGGPHGESNATADINGGKMDGFIQQEQKGSKVACKTILILPVL